MENIYDNFIKELKELGKRKYKKISADDLYCRVEEKLKCFLCKNKNEVDINKFKIILKAEHDSIDLSYYLSLPLLTIGVVGMLFSLVPLLFDISDDIIYKRNAVLVLYICIIMFIIQFYIKEWKSKKLYTKKKALNICLEMIEANKDDNKEIYNI